MGDDDATLKGLTILVVEDTLLVAEVISDGLAMRRGKELTWSQVVMAANTPMLLKAGLVDGNTDAGVLASGQVAGILEDLPSCAELIESIVRDAIKHLQAASGLVDGA